MVHGPTAADLYRTPAGVPLEQMTAVLRSLYRPTIARDLAIGLAVTSFVVFGIAGTTNYIWSLRRDTRALNEKAREHLDNLALVVATPMWNFDVAELTKIRDVYLQSEIVYDISMQDDTGRMLVAPSRPPGGAFLEMTRRVRHEEKPAGQVMISFSDAEITRRHSQIALYSILLFGFLTTSIVAATYLLLRRIVTRPFGRLKTGLDLISAGQYRHRFEPERQDDLNAINEKVMEMATGIAERQLAIEDNAARLEILNHAILDLFSCSDTDSLIRTTLQLAYKACAVERSCFLAPAAVDPDSDEKASGPVPLLCVDGTAREVDPGQIVGMVGRDDQVHYFSFPIKSRHRTVGTITMEYAEPPGAALVAMLKTITAIASQAMARQWFIRESAFIATELQVAETIQRSMLHDDAHAPRGATVAWHYQPVHRVGGDWFSVVESRDASSLYVLLGDVTGHGLAQGLVTTAMAGAVNVLESQIRNSEGAQLPAPSAILTQLGTLITRLTGKSNLRMTCVAARIDYVRNRVTVCNAGHTFPVLLHQHADEPVRPQTLARNQQHMLGDDWAAEAGTPYSDTDYELHADDLLVFYTDGLTEARNGEGRPFARVFQRLFHRQAAGTDPLRLRDLLMRSFHEHTGDLPAKDDICLVVIGRSPRSTAGRAA